MRRVPWWGWRAGRRGGLLLALLLLGCATAPATRTQSGIAHDEERADVLYQLECDKVSGEKVCVMIGNPLIPLTPRYPLLSLGAMRKDRAEGAEPEYFLRLVYVNMVDWLHVGEGTPLHLTIDGATQVLAGAGSAPERIQGESGKVFEIALFPVSLDVLKRIATARQVTVRVKGAFELEKHLNSGNQLFFAMFVRKYSGASLDPGAR
jgi:hypothetical protein